MKYNDKLNLLAKDEWKAIEDEMNLTYNEDILIEATQAQYSGGIWLSFYLRDEKTGYNYLFGFTIYKRDFYEFNGDCCLTAEAYRAVSGYKEALWHIDLYERLLAQYREKL